MAKKKLTPSVIERTLDYPFYAPDLDDHTTLREYLHNLLAKLVHEGEGFSSKRPFGDSGWECNFDVPLVGGGAVRGEVLHPDDPNWDEDEVGNSLMAYAIDVESKDIAPAMKEILEYLFGLAA